MTSSIYVPKPSHNNRLHQYELNPIRKKPTWHGRSRDVPVEVIEQLVGYCKIKRLRDQQRNFDRQAKCRHRWECCRSSI